MTRHATTLVFGARPRADLLPREIRARIRGRRLRRLSTLAVVAVVVLAAGGITAAHLVAARDAGLLAAAQQQTQGILTRQAASRRVTTVKNQIGLTLAAQQAGSATEIDWAKYVAALAAVQPQGITVTAVTTTTPSNGHDAGPSTTAGAGSAAGNAGSGSTSSGGTGPSSAGTSGTASNSAGAGTAADSTVPVAQVTLTATATSLTTIADWLDDLTRAPGFLGLSEGPISGGPGSGGAGSASSDPGSGTYTLTVTLDVGARAFSNRFQPQSGTVHSTTHGTGDAGDGGAQARRAATLGTTPGGNAR